MSHEIDQSTGKAAVFTAGALPWHGLGVNVADAVDSETVRKLSITDWLVEKKPLQYTFGDTLHTALDHFVMVRMDTGAQLGFVGPAYTPFQNHEATELLDSLHDEGVKYVTAGSLFGGSLVWYLMQIPAELRVPGTDDVSYPFIMASMGHDGIHALNLFPLFTRVVCWNTHQTAMNEKGDRGYNIRHYRTLPDKVKAAKKGLHLIQKRTERYQEEMTALCQVQLSDSEVKAYFTSLLPKPKKEKKESAREVLESAGLLDSIIEASQSKVDIIADLLAADDENASRAEKNNKKILEILMNNWEHKEFKEIEGTAWKAFNCVTNYQDHSARTRGADERSRMENRMFSSVFGKGSDLKEKAFELALEYVPAKV